MYESQVRPVASRILVTTAGLLLVFGCSTAPRTVRVNPDVEADISDTRTDSRDLRGVCRAMVESMAALPIIAGATTPPRVAFLSVENRTNEYLDTATFLEKIRTDLIKFSAGKIVFLDRQHTESILQERADKRAGELTAGREGRRFGADYFLTGVISSIDKQEARTRSTYTRYAFRLVDAETEAIYWEDDYEVKKISRSAAWNE